MWQLYIARASSMFGVTHTRGLYEKAIAALGDAQARDMCLQYADLERKVCIVYPTMRRFFPFSFADLSLYLYILNIIS
jgi:hypothetical protein